MGVVTIGGAESAKKFPVSTHDHYVAPTVGKTEPTCGYAQSTILVAFDDLNSSLLRLINFLAMSRLPTSRNFYDVELSLRLDDLPHWSPLVL